MNRPLLIEVIVWCEKNCNSEWDYIDYSHTLSEIWTLTNRFKYHRIVKLKDKIPFSTMNRQILFLFETKEEDVLFKLTFG